MVKAVVFDMDGVLFDTEKLTAESWEKAGEALGCSNVMSVISQFLGLNSVYQEKRFHELFGEDFPYEEFIEYGRKYSADYIAEHGIPVKPGVFELLDYLKGNGYLVAAASSTRYATVTRHFEDVGITGYFHKIIGGDLVEKSKPDPEIYLQAASALGVAPQDCMALEDSPNGLTSAYHAGMKTVMVPDTIQPTPELREMLFACVPSLHDVIPLLEEQKA